MKTYIFNGKFMSDKHNDKSVFIAMEGDNNSGVVTFEFDRFYPDRKGVDLGAFAWQLEVTGYILPEPHENVIGELTGLSKEVRGSTISVRWTVGGENTFLSGEGEAQLKAIGANGEVWKSEPFTVVVGQSINADGVAELYPGILTELSARALALEGRMDTAESDIETLQGNVDALGSDKQDKYDETLTTTDKTVVGAINEVKNASDIAKQTADGAKNTAEAIDGKATEALEKAQEALEQAGNAVQTEADPTVPSWAKQSTKPSYSAAEIANLETISNLVNYYKKNETYTKTEVNNLISAIPKLTITAVSELPESGDATKIYVIGNKEYLWLEDEERYEQFGDLSVDLSDYYTKSQVDTALADKANASHAHAAGDVNSGTFAEARIPNLPTSKITGLADVATSGDYDDLANKPSIPPEQVNADWNASSGKAEILNKPTIPDAQIQSDWTQSDTGAKDYIKNKPTIPTLPSIASQAEAEAGTNNAKMMTALRVKQAIDTLAPEYILPTATDTVLGGVKVGENLSIENGVLSAPSGGWPLTIKEGF